MQRPDSLRWVRHPGTSGGGRPNTFRPALIAAGHEHVPVGPVLGTMRRWFDGSQRQSQRLSSIPWKETAQQRGRSWIRLVSSRSWVPSTLWMGRRPCVACQRTRSSSCVTSGRSSRRHRAGRVVTRSPGTSPVPAVHDAHHTAVAPPTRRPDGPWWHCPALNRASRGTGMLPRRAGQEGCEAIVTGH